MAYGHQQSYGGNSSQNRFKGIVDGVTYNDPFEYNIAVSTYLERKKAAEENSLRLEELLAQMQSSYDEAKAANLERYDLGLGMYDDIASASKEAYGLRENQLRQMTDADLDAIIGGYDDRYRQGMAILNGMGGQAQMARDRRRMKSLAADKNPVNLRANPALAGQVAGSMQSGTNRDFNEEDAAAEDAMRRQRFAAYQGMSREAQAAQDAYRQQRSRMLDNARAEANQAAQKVPLEKIGFITRREDMYPSLRDQASLIMGAGRGTGEFDIDLVKQI